MLQKKLMQLSDGSDTQYSGTDARKKKLTIAGGPGSLMWIMSQRVLYEPGAIRRIRLEKQEGTIANYQSGNIEDEDLLDLLQAAQVSGDEGSQNEADDLERILDEGTDEEFDGLLDVCIESENMIGNLSDLAWTAECDMEDLLDREMGQILDFVSFATGAGHCDTARTELRISLENRT